MKPPQSFYEFTLQFHQDLDLVYPDWSTTPHGRDEIYEGFAMRYGTQAVAELSEFMGALLVNREADLGSLWFNESKADLIIQDEGVRFLFKDFLSWAASQS